MLYSMQVPPADELSAIYARVYADGNLYQTHLDQLDLLKAKGEVNVGRYRAAVFLDRFLPSPGDRLLEVGCGVGIFLVAAQRKGWKVEGVDLSRTALEASRTVHGLPATLGMLEDLPLDEGAYKAVVGWEVLEHMVNPRKFLAKVRSLLRKDGLFVCSVPNAGRRAPQAALPGPAARPPIHLNFWDRSSLAELFRQNGFRILHLAPSRSMLSAVHYRKQPLRFLLWQLGAIARLFEGPHLYAVVAPS